MEKPPASTQDAPSGNDKVEAAAEQVSANREPSGSQEESEVENIPAAERRTNSDDESLQVAKERADGAEPTKSGRSEGVAGWHKQVGQHIGSGNVRKAGNDSSSSSSSSSSNINNGSGDAKPQGQGNNLEQRPKWDDRVKVEHHDEVFLEDRSSLDGQPAGNATSSRSPSQSPTGAASGARKRKQQAGGGGKSPRVDHVASWKSEVGQHLGSGSAAGIKPQQKEDGDDDDIAAADDDLAAASEEKIESSEDKMPESKAEDRALEDGGSGGGGGGGGGSGNETTADTSVEPAESHDTMTLVTSVPTRSRSRAKESNSSSQSETTTNQPNASAQGPGHPLDQTSDADVDGDNDGVQSNSSTKNNVSSTAAATTTTSSGGVSVRKLVSSPLLSVDTPRPVFVVVGDSAGMTHAAHRRFHNVFKNGVLKAALHTGAFVVDATDDPFHTGVLHGLLMGLKPRLANASDDSATGSQTPPLPPPPMVKICIKDGPAAASGAGNVSGPPAVEVERGGAEFSCALLDIIRKLSTPPAPAAGSIVAADPSCEVVVLLFSNPVTAGNKRWHSTSSTLCALRALAPQHSHRRLPLVDFRTKSERAGAPKRIAGAVSQFEETFDFEPRKGRTAEKVAASLHIITSVPFLRSRMK